MTRREEIIELLKKEEMTSLELARAFQTKQKTILLDLKHIRKTLKSKSENLVVRMPFCRQCGFQFKLTSIKEPSKCPQCDSTWIEPPAYKVIA
jgi:predicted Zn-ribbon and HTH transcriptional regulator